MGKFRNFGRIIFRFYQQYPIMMNSFAGAAVYGLGEVVVQYSTPSKSDPKEIDLKRVAGITALGSVGTYLYMIIFHSNK